MLGVHIRGTDFNQRNKNHPIAISIDEYIEAIREIFDQSDYTNIFIATDVKDAIDHVKKVFGEECVCYYQDVLRSNNGNPVHKSANKRKYHKFLLGCEVLRDAYTLAECDGFIAGRSQVSLAVQVIKKSRDEEWINLKIIDKGMYR